MIPGQKLLLDFDIDVEQDQDEMRSKVGDQSFDMSHALQSSDGQSSAFSKRSILSKASSVMSLQSKKRQYDNKKQIEKKEEKVVEKRRPKDEKKSKLSRLYGAQKKSKRVSAWQEDGKIDVIPFSQITRHMVKQKVGPDSYIDIRMSNSDWVYQNLKRDFKE